MKRTAMLIVLMVSVSACVVVPTRDKQAFNQCSISSDKQTLKLVNVAEETETYYSITGIILTPIIIPTSAIVSGTYVLVNNAYNLGEETIICD